MVREAVQKLSLLGPLPSEDLVEDEFIRKFQDTFEVITRPVSDEEAEMLCELFGPDECYGIAWALLHLIETAPGWPILSCLEGHQNEWKQRLRHRWETAVLLGSDKISR